MRVYIYLGLLVILVLAILVRLHIINNILINGFITEPLLFADLLGKGKFLPWKLILFMDLANIFLIFLIGRKILDNKFGLLSAFVYGILPWMAYGVLFGSSYIFFLFFLLVFFYGIFILKENRIGFLLIIISSCVMFYSVFFSLFVLPILIIGIGLVRLISPFYLKVYIVIMAIVFIPIIILSFNNQVGLNNIYNNQIGIFKDPGLKNSIDVFQGESRKAGFNYLVKLGESKYLYLSKYFLLKLFSNIVPSTYFTPQSRLFNFSFTPPVYVGLLIPFLYGIYLVSKIKRAVLGIVFLVLILPSILSKQLVDLNRLIIFSPIIIFLISFGFIEFYKKRAKPIFGFFLILGIFLVLFQFAVTLSDIQFREPFRYKISQSPGFARINDEK